MPSQTIVIRRFTVISAKPFDEVLSKLRAAVGHPDMSIFRKDLTAAKNEAELEKIVQAAVGPTGLMEFTAFDFGEVLRKELGPAAPKSVRLLIGNPVIMKQMTKTSPDAGSYAPVTILVDERADGVHLTYDLMASFLAPYNSAEALQVARDLDAKVQSLLSSAAQ